MDNKAQNSLEYLLIVGGAIIIAVIVISLVLALTGTEKGSVGESMKAYLKLIYSTNPS